MASPAAASLAEGYWGYLIAPNKAATPKFERLLLAIAHHIEEKLGPRDVHVLTPAKLAAFYRSVGGNYDALFLDSPPASVAFIYKALGCFHSLQPGPDAFQAPALPALTPHGFARWQTIQLLLGPDEHVPYLQAAVRGFGLVDPVDRAAFPKTLPAECLPRAPDRDMTLWHDGVADTLRRESELRARAAGAAAAGTTSPPPPQRRPVSRDHGRAASDSAEHLRPSSGGRAGGHSSPGRDREREREHHEHGLAAVPLQIRTKFKNLNFTSIFSPHARPPAPHPPNSPSPTSGPGHAPQAPAPPPQPLQKGHGLRHGPASGGSRHRPKSNISTTSSSSASSGGMRGRHDRSPSPPPQPPRRSSRHPSSRSQASSPASRDGYSGRSGRSHSAHREPQPPPSPHRLAARPALHHQRRHSAQAPSRERDRDRYDRPERPPSGARRSPRSPPRVSPAFLGSAGAAAAAGGSRPVSQAGPAAAPAAPTMGPPPPGQPLPPPAQPLPGAPPAHPPLQQVRSAPLAQGAFPQAGQRYSVAGYPIGAAPAPRRADDPAPRFAGDDPQRRRRSEFLDEGGWERERPAESRRRARERAGSLSRR